MAWYTYEPAIALDPTNPLVVAQNSPGQIYAMTDTANLTPLIVKDVVSGSSKTVINSSAQGFIEAFLVENQRVVKWKSGDHITILSSIQGFVDDTTLAVANSQTSASAAAGSALDANTSRLAAEDAVARLGVKIVILTPTAPLPVGTTDGTLIVRTAT